MRKWPVLILIASTILIGDQVSKYLAVEHLTAAFDVAHATSFSEKVSAFVSQKDLLERRLDTAPIDVSAAGFSFATRRTREPRSASPRA